jgi:hypothetical protein
VHVQRSTPTIPLVGAITPVFFILEPSVRERDLVAHDMLTKVTQDILSTSSLPYTADFVNYRYSVDDQSITA